MPLYEFECGRCGARFEEQRNAQLRDRTKRKFKSARERARAKARGHRAGES